MKLTFSSYYFNIASRNERSRFERAIRVPQRPRSGGPSKWVDTEALGAAGFFLRSGLATGKTAKKASHVIDTIHERRRLIAELIPHSPFKRLLLPVLHPVKTTSVLYHAGRIQLSSATIATQLLGSGLFTITRNLFCRKNTTYIS